MRPRRNTFSQNIRARSAELLNKQLTSAIDLDLQVKQAHWEVPERPDGGQKVHPRIDHLRHVPPDLSISPGKAYARITPKLVVDRPSVP